MLLPLLLCAALPTTAPWVWADVDRRLEGADPALCLSRFAGYPSGAANDRFTPNTNFWAKGIDFTCVSPWNSAGGSLRAGTLISRRHIIFAQHFPLAKGARILFVDDEGAVCPCYIEATKAIAGSDIMIGLLNAEVAPNIHPAKILPPDFQRHVGRAEQFPVVTFNQKEQLFLTRLAHIPTNLTLRVSMCSWKPKNKNRARFRDKIIVGDSGNPAFLLIKDQPVLIYCLHRGGCGSGPSIHLYRREIQATMDELCPGYKLESFDFSRLTDRK